METNKTQTAAERANLKPGETFYIYCAARDGGVLRLSVMERRDGKMVGLRNTTRTWPLGVAQRVIDADLLALNSGEYVRSLPPGIVIL